jgi:hypothetical protein
MTRAGLLVLFLLVLAGAAAAWWYVAGGLGINAAKLVPGDTLAFACIPDGESVFSDYQGSQLRQIVDSPNTQPLIDWIEQQVGDKNLGLPRVLLPDLSGQSFVAVTHFDPANPSGIGFVAAMKPKLGRDNFDTFVQQLNAAYPEMAGETRTGHDTLLGVDYQWIESTHGGGRLCVARSHGWIVTAWGEASLQDWLERMQGKPSTPSLADNDDFKKSRERVGTSAQALVYVNYARAAELMTGTLAASNPALAESLKKRLESVGGAALGTSFDHGEIVDRFSMLEPKQAQLDAGMATSPCPFDTLKFTGPDTRFYYGASINWPQVWKNLQAQTTAGQPGLGGFIGELQTLAQSENIDLEKNVFDALGQEYSVQIEWASDALYPDVGVYFKVDKEADFKPAIAALIDLSRKQFASSAVINEMQVDGHNFATLKTVQPLPVSPTITEDGPYFGFFLNETHAARSLARDESRGLLHNDDFNRQTGSQRDGASQLFFLDAPKLLDQAYRTALPYVSLGAMFNPTIAALIKDRTLPADLTWLAPMGTWSAVIKSDDDGVTGYSRSGVGNQGILVAGGLGAGGFALQSLGLLPQHRYTVPTPGNPFPPAAGPVNAPAPAGMPAVPPPPPAPMTTPTPAVPPAPGLPPAPATPAPTVPPTPPAPSNATTPPSPPASTH